MVRWKAGAITIANIPPSTANKAIVPMIKRRRFARVMGGFWLRCSVGLGLDIRDSLLPFYRGKHRDKP
ncbi:hypothetical protein [Paraburkholderia sacchari]|uniref:hypothetical protein n=1 Tax=Paraburkholderia sacchari TaxID=159450 RepID=UPI003D95FC35